MKFRHTIVLLFATFSVSWAQAPKELVGKYQLDAQGGDTLELRADGTASLAGDNLQWAARGNQLQVGPDLMTYVLKGDRLVVHLGTVQLVWKRVGNGTNRLSPMARAATKANTTEMPPSQMSGNPQDAQARQVLTGSAWCSFTYNKVSGTSTTRRVVFRPDGVMSINGGAETYSSGNGGTYAGQSTTGGMMLWKVENLRLLIDQRKGSGFQDIGLTTSKNSNGYPILHAEGREYSMCN